MNDTTVRSTLAKTDAKDTASVRCTSSYTLKQTFGSAKRGTVLHCERPASSHRVHEALGFLQWGK